MPDRKSKAADSKGIADLFRVLRNMCSDEAVSDANFRLAFRIAQNVNARTGWGEASHTFLIDEVPRTNKAKIRRFRREMEGELGWVRVFEGTRGRGTRYQFRDERCASIEAICERARDERHAQAALEKIRLDTAQKVAGLGVKSSPLTDDAAGSFRGEISPPNGVRKGVRSTPDRGSVETPVLPHSTTSTEGYREENETQDARAHLPAGGHGQARADIPSTPLQDDEDDTIPESPSPAIRSANSIRCACGEPALSEIQLEPKGRFIPHCFECGEDSIPLEVRPLRAANYPVADYRLVRDGS